MKKLVSLVVACFLLCLVTSAWAAPTAPAMSINTSGTSITISWSTVENAVGYRLYYAPYPFVGEETIGNIDMLEETTTSFLLWEGAAYYVAVTAYDDSGESEYSNIELFIMGPPTPEWVDDDYDGYSEMEGDCDDSNSFIYPGAPEICGDGIDQDCSGSDETCSVDPDDIDNDGDGYTENQGDCNDAVATIHPGALEVCGDGIDQDCSGSDETCQPIVFLDKGNGTVYDKVTNLIWQQSDDDVQRTWQSAIYYCAALTLGGSSSWRLPSIEELESLIDTTYSPTIDPIFTGVNADIYWSSTSLVSGYAYPPYAWRVNFDNGLVNGLHKSYYKFVRCVR